MEFFNKLGKSNKNALLVLGLIVFMILCLGLVTYLFFYNNNEQASYGDATQATGNTTQAIETTTQSSSAPQAPQEVAQSNTTSSQEQPQAPQETAQSNTASSNTTSQEQPKNIAATESTDKNASSASANVKSDSSSNAKNATNAKSNTKSNTITALKYAIVPNNIDIFECNTMMNGKWDMPKKCKDSALKAIQKLIDDNNELIALEVNGIVDSNPYAGPSAELKQEGLASFRAREAIGSIIRAYSNVAVFEGISMQQNNKRGFQIKAYYLKNNAN